MKKSAIIIGATLGLAIMPSALSAVALAPRSLGAAPSPDAVIAMVERFRAAVRSLAPDASQQDIEAALMYAADQSGQPQDVVIAALEQVLRETPTRLAANALEIIIAAQRRSTGRGTGALAGEEALDLYGEDTGPPVVLGGGVDSDYTS